MSEQGNGVEYRFRRLEDAINALGKRVEGIDEHGSRRVGVIEADLRHNSEQFGEFTNELREVRAEIRDLRHRVNGIDAAMGNLTRIVEDQGKTVTTNSQKVDGFMRSILVSSLGLALTVVATIVTMWLTVGGGPGT